MEREPSTISPEITERSADRLHEESVRSIGRIATREFDSEIYTTLEDDLQEMPDLYLLRLHDSVCDEGPEYSYVLTRVKKELARRQLEY